jgi:hypothetical protein
VKLIIDGLGPIKKPVELVPKQLTVLMGANNTGKTYALYLLNALLDSRLAVHHQRAKEMATTLLRERSLDVSMTELVNDDQLRQVGTDLGQALKNALPRFFASEEDFGADTRIEVQLDRDHVMASAQSADSSELWGKSAVAWRLPNGEVVEGEILVTRQDTKAKFLLRGEVDDHAVSVRAIESSIASWLSSFYLPERSGRDFLLPAERSGVNLFFRELNSRRAALLRHVTSQTLDTAELLKDIIVSRYPSPIQDYIEFLSSQPELKRSKSEFADLADELQTKVLQVKYKIDRNGDISIIPAKSGGKNLGLHLGSSTVKTFFGLWSYLNHAARKGDWLMIDEPELNLHPSNQIAIAQLLAKVARRGVYVVVSTHSDYMVRLWGNLTMLGANRGAPALDEIARTAGLDDAAYLSPDMVAAYEFSHGSSKELVVDSRQGIVTKLFDDNIEALNSSAQQIYFAIQDLDEPQVKLGTLAHE